MTKLLRAAMAERYPKIYLTAGQSHRFEATLFATAADKRAKSTDPKAGGNPNRPMPGWQKRG